MPTPVSHFDLLLQLPLDASLLDFLSGHGLPLTHDAVAGADAVTTAIRLAEAIDAAPAPIRDRIMADFRQVALLSDAPGMGYMLSASQSHPDVLDGLSTLTTPAQRALWLYRHHRELFDEAEEMRWVDDYPRNLTQQRDLRVALPVDRSEEARTGLAQALSRFLMERERCGQSCQAFLIERPAEQAVQVTVYLQDHASHQTEFVSGQLQRRPSTPARHMAIVYSPAQGIARTLARGGVDYHQALVDRFARHMLHVEVEAQRIRPVQLVLENLRQPLSLPDDLTVDTLRLREATLIDEVTGGEITIRAPARNQNLAVQDLLEGWMPTDNPLRKDRFRVAAAKVGVSFLPDEGQRRGRAVSLALKKRGGTNLEDFDERTRAKLERWLVSWRLVPGQGTLSANDDPAQVPPLTTA